MFDRKFFAYMSLAHLAELGSRLREFPSFSILIISGRLSEVVHGDPREICHFTCTHRVHCIMQWITLNKQGPKN